MNAALKVKEHPPLVLGRDQAYIGVMLDDLVTRELEEPYRLLTSRAEYRLLLRQDNADLRLTPIAHELGLVDRARHEAVQRKREAVEHEIRRLSREYLNPGARVNALLERLGIRPLGRGTAATELLRRPEVTYQTLLSLAIGDASLPAEFVEQVQVAIKYQGYIDKQQREVERVQRLEERLIPREFDYEAVTGFRKEAREKLMRFRPASVGQASRIMGVNPADMAILLVHLERASTVRVAAG